MLEITLSNFSINNVAPSRTNYKFHIYSTQKETFVSVKTDNTQINKTYSINVAKNIISKIGPIIKNLKFHQCRKMYYGDELVIKSDDKILWSNIDAVSCGSPLSICVTKTDQEKFDYITSFLYSILTMIFKNDMQNIFRKIYV